MTKWMGGEENLSERVERQIKKFEEKKEGVGKQKSVIKGVHSPLQKSADHRFVQ